MTIFTPTEPSSPPPGRVWELAAELGRLLGLRRGSYEVHLYNGEPQAINKLDKSLRRGQHKSPTTE